VISEFVRSYLPLSNPIGFGASDSVIFTLAALLVVIALAWTCLERPARWLAQRSMWCLLPLAVLPAILRLALLRTHPVPTPNTADDFGYLLLGDTLAHLRLANPIHPLHQFFEAVFILQEPSYSSSFPPGQGIALALGQILFGSPWAGVVLSVSALCASSYWMLRGWTTPLWALIGALLAVFEFGPLSQWMNSYWGGAVTASAGCLVFGSLPRLRAGWRNRDAALLGAGLGVHMLTRPFESILLMLCVVLYFVPVVTHTREWRGLGKVPIMAPIRAMTIALLAATPAIGLTLLHDRAVTGNWTTLPYMLSQYQYGVPAAFTVQPNPAPHRMLTHEQAIDYQAQRLVHGEGTDTVRSYFSGLLYRLRFYRFFFFAPLYLVLPIFLFSLREFRFLWALLAVIIFSVGTNFYPYFYPHYIAALTCVFLLISVTALERLSRWSLRGSPVGKEIARSILFLCAAQFLFWYGIHLSGSPQLLEALGPYETWDYINYGDFDGRAAINQRLAQAPGKQLVFVQYWPRHLFDEWIHNAASIDASRVVFAADLGSGENEKLRRYYPDRTAWILEPDARPPRLTPYPSAPAEEEVQPGPAEPPPQPTRKPGRNRIDPKTIETVR
jgi:hypothetical protein